MADGLPYPAALAVAQDGEGFIWAGTAGGVARWDGYGARVFRHDDADPNSLPENTVMQMLADERGRIWLATASGLVARYDEAIQGFVVFRDQGNGLGPIFGMASDHKGGLWVSGRRGLAHLNGTSRTWRFDVPGSIGSPRGEVGGILVDRAGWLWIGTAEGLMRRRGVDGPFETLPMPAEMAGDLATAIFEDQGGLLWFGTREGRLGKIDPKRGEVRSEPALAPSRQIVSAIVEPSPGMLWIGEFGGGIRQFTPQSGAVAHFGHDPSAAASLGDDTVTGMIVDRSGLVWASNQRGLDRHIPRNNAIVTVMPGGPQGLLGSDVRSVAASADGKLWLGSRAEGLALMDPFAGVVLAIRPGTGPADLPKDRIQAIADTADGGVWVGLSKGLFRIDVATGQAHPLAKLANAGIRALLHDSSGLWAGGSMGLAHITPEDGTTRLYQQDKGDPSSLSDNSAATLFRDKAQRLWVGTWRGLNLLEDAEQGTFRRFLHDPADPQSLPSDNINSLTEDHLGRLWVATSNGIGILDPKEPGKARFRRLGTSEGLPNATVLMLLTGPQGILASTGDGLALIDADSLAIRRFEAADGMAIRTFWAGSGAGLPDGTLVMGGYGGMVVVGPAAPPHWAYVPPILLTNIRVGGRDVSRTSAIAVRPEDRSIQMDFSALDYSAPERNRYAYRLDDSDDVWTITDATHRTAIYTNLSPGTHRLMVRASNSGGVWNQAPFVQKFRVWPSWYQTMWFQVLGALAGFAAITGLFRVRATYYLRREREFTRQVAARTVEAETAREEAEAANMAKSRFLAVIGHEIRTPLNGLLGMLQLLRPEGLAEDQQESLLTAKRAGRNLKDLVESVLEYGRENVGGPAIPPEDVDIHRLAAEVLDLFRELAKAKDITLDLKVSSPPPTWICCERTLLSRVLLNLVGNAVKFTDKGGVCMRISVAQRGDGAILLVTVADSGIGISPEMREAIFQDFVQGDDSITRRFGGAGLGLAISRRIATQMGGSLTVVSEKGVGSAFHLAVPVEKASEPLTDHPAIADGPSLKVLVVDDDEINRRVAQKLLGHLGHQAIAVDSGEAAIAAVMAEPFDVVLMDLRMPGQDGMEVTRRIREYAADDRSRLRIVAMTADLTEEVGRDCTAAGMDSALAKPVQLEDLKRLLASVPAARPPAPSPRPGEDGRLDMAFLTDQLEILGPAEMVRLAHLFQRATRQMIAAMETASQADDRATILAMAHRLRSAAGPLALKELADAAALVEALAASASGDDLIKSVAGLRADRLAALEALRRASRSLRRSAQMGSTATPSR